MPRGKRRPLIYGFGWRHLFLGPRKTVPPQVRAFLKDHEGRSVVGITVGKAPISSLSRKVVNALTFGNYNKRLKAKGYDAGNHAYMVVTLDDGSKYKMEKNHVVEIAPAGAKSYWDKIDKSSHDTPLDERELQVTQPIPLGTFMSNGEKYASTGDKQHEFWKYDPVNANCQYYVDDLVSGNKDSIANVEVEREFYFQPGVGETVQPEKPLIQLPINLGAIWHRFRHGDGLRHHLIRRRHDDATYNIY
jgi:hypothetical protein